MYRSHLGKLVTKTVNKIVAIPVLKDHGSAGVTGALKNMSHGTVNNVNRSHSTPFTNVCNQFIPQMVSHPIIRQKFVLQIMDGIRGVYQGGPFSRDNGKWTWEYNAIFFATDPVALDHVEWDIVDAKRIEQNLPPVAATGGKAHRPLEIRGLRRPPAAAHRPGRCAGAWLLRSQIEQGPAVFDPAPRCQCLIPGLSPYEKPQVFAEKAQAAVSAERSRDAEAWYKTVFSRRKP